MFLRLLALGLSLGLASLASGCFLDGTAFQAGNGGGGADAPAGGGGEGGTTHGTTSAGGAGGSGAGSTTGSTGTTGTTGSTTTSSTTESMTTSTTTTTGSMCTYDTDCPDPDLANICLEPRCANGVCTEKTSNEGMVCGLPPDECYDYPTCQSGQCNAAPLPSGEPLIDLDLKDCKKPVCDGNGNAISMADPSQVPDSTECADKSCSGTSVTVSPKADGESCFVAAAFKCCSGHCCDVVTCLGCVD